MDEIVAQAKTVSNEEQTEETADLSMANQADEADDNDDEEGDENEDCNEEGTECEDAPEAATEAATLVQDGSKHPLTEAPIDGAWDGRGAFKKSNVWSRAANSGDPEDHKTLIMGFVYGSCFNSCTDPATNQTVAWDVCEKDLTGTNADCNRCDKCVVAGIKELFKPAPPLPADEEKTAHVLFHLTKR